MRIALVYDGVFPHTLGGGEKVFHDLAHHLGGRHEVHLLGMKHWEGPSTLQTAPSVYLHGICRPVSAYKHGARGQRSLGQALRFAASAANALLSIERVDIVDCMATPYFPLYASYLPAKLRRIPLVSTWLELWRDDHWREYLGGGIKGYLAQKVETCAVWVPQHIIAISQHTAEGLKRCGIPDRRISVVPPWVDCDAIEKTPAGDTPSDILFAGRLVETKGVHLLLQALARLRERLPEIRCRVIGEGPERQRLENMSRELGLQDCVEFSGFLEHHRDVLAAMKASRLLALLSDREGFGIVVVEAAACGLPTVTLEAPNNAAANLVRDSGCGAVCSEDPDDIAEALKRQIEAQPVQSGKAKSWARKYDRPHIAARYESIYANVALGNRVEPGSDSNG
jgi:glycosyltransferase involved in cell wall biosynthesis